MEPTLHASLLPIDDSERQMLFEALDGLEPGCDLLVLDRGYPGNALLATLAQRRLAFCTRVDAVSWRCVSEFLHSGQSESIVALGAPCMRDSQTYEIERQPTRVRLIRGLTPNGRVRVLMTNLLDPVAYSAKQFGALYHRHWRIEEAFKRLKHRLMLEAVSGLTYLALQQDFMAKVLADNLCAALARADVSEHTDSRPNRTCALGALCTLLAAYLLGVRHALDALAPTIEAIDRVRCRIQPDRHSPRPRRQKPHHYSTHRRAL